MTAFPKPRPAKLERLDRKRERARIDRLENAKVKRRSTGFCEVIVTVGERIDKDFGPVTVTRVCPRHAAHVHHLLCGIGVRGRGESALARNKLHVCAKCHSDIHAKVLIRDGSTWRRMR